jgi:probable F420-dependent oxidoreductase
MDIEFGVMLPHRWTYASADNIADYVRLAEDLGYDHVWVTDHIGVPPTHQERGHIFYESLTVLSYVAAITSKVRLGTVVLVASVRNPLVTSKQLGTIDRLSKGRVLMGIGTGWIKEEIDSVGATPYDNKLDYLREFIEVLKASWSSKQKEISYRGKYFNFENLILEPKPFNNESIPVLVGGNTPVSVRLATELGDGWVPWAIGRDRLIKGLNILSDKQKKLVYLASPVQIKKIETSYVGALGEKHMILAGDEAQLKGKIEEFVSLGVTRFVLSFEDVRLFKGSNYSDIVNDTRIFASGIMRSF